MEMLRSQTQDGEATERLAAARTLPTQGLKGQQKVFYQSTEIVANQKEPDRIKEAGISQGELEPQREGK